MDKLLNIIMKNLSRKMKNRILKRNRQYKENNTT